MAEVHVGAYRLERVVGHGASAQVWRAAHSVTGATVALKVLTSEAARDPAFVQRLRDEVRTVARLHHPHVVPVVDTGTVDDDAEEASRGGLIAGSPFLVMELVEGATLTRLISEPTDWSTVRNVVLAILDALSHAHARDIVHCDLKPSNVLIEGEDVVVPRVADFGIARSVGSHTSGIQTRITGTPRYMAPEQILGRRRDFGPWTDLYAVGCVVHTLLSGSPLFEGTLEGVLDAHLHTPPPALRPRMAVPDGAEEWLLRLLCKSPRGRLASAADAAFLLSRLGEPDHQELRDVDLDVPHDAPTVVTPTFRAIAIDRTEPLRRVDAKVAAVLRETQPPVPETWRRDDSNETDGPSAVGIGLFHVREVPIVGREALRDAMWEVLRETHADRSIRVVLLKGPAGTGKSRLAQWICRRAAEVGAASRLRASHSPEEGPLDGLGPMFERALGCHDLDADEVTARLEELFGPDDHLHGDARVLASMRASVDKPDATSRWYRPIDRHLAMRRLLRRFTRSRPVAMWLDDLHASTDTLQWLTTLCDDPADLPVVVFGTLRDDLLARDDIGTELFDELANHESCHVHHVGPLGEQGHRALVESLLVLDRRVVQSISRRSAGNPLFAIQLVADAVDRGLLVPGPTGFSLADNMSPHLPENLRQVWQQRLERLIEGTGLDSLTSWRTMERIAVLGDEVDLDELRGVCEADGLTVRDELLESLARARLAERRQRRFGFVHGMLRETLVEHADQAGRLRDHHRACAAGLRALPQSTDPRHLARVGRHLFGAGEWRAALEPLERASKSMFHSDLASVRALIDLHHRAWSELGEAEREGRRASRAEELVLRGRIAWMDGDPEKSKRFAERAVTLARQVGEPATLAEALRLQANLTCHHDVEEALEQIEEAILLLRSGDRLDELATMLISAAFIRGFIGRDYDAALDHLDRALEIAGELDDPDIALPARHYRSGLHIEAHRPEEAYDDATIGYDRARALGMEKRIADFVLIRGSALYHLERHDEGRELMLEAMRRFDEQGDRNSEATARYNLGLIEVARSDFQSAFHHLTKLLKERRDLIDVIGLTSAVHFGLAACAADAGDWDRFDDSVVRAQDCIDQMSNPDDLATVVERAAELALEAGHRERALDLFDEAIRAYRTASNSDEADRLADVVSELRGR